MERHALTRLLFLSMLSLAVLVSLPSPARSTVTVYADTTASCPGSK